ncbi:MutS-related protein [Actinoallomurus acaciae]|uniref:DNA mismatch repair proteins mutS family domain-containing protein n=1 Tax=Actinoallomurus acaciae TaxID=502577 RepID=A0ABV5YKA0_9ACTN
MIRIPGRPSGRQGPFAFAHHGPPAGPAPEHLHDLGLDITGANGGGKTTFLRSVGVAHLMTHSGMFVAARSLTASITGAVTGAVHTHFRREEDHTMTSGKALRPGDLVLCNESFMSTNEREGSTIAAEIIRALTDLGIRVVFVTHLYDFARRTLTGRCLFLSAARGHDGERPFRLTPGAPSPTADAADV